MKQLIAYLKLADGVNGKIPNFETSHSTDMDNNKLMRTRQNLHYVHSVHIYAPCIVSSRVWNDKSNMMRNCTDSELLFRENVFTISDKAFMLLVLINYTATWMQEIQDEHHKVCQLRQHRDLLHGFMTLTFCFRFVLQQVETHQQFLLPLLS
jgi:hypothetical protein